MPPVRSENVKIDELLDQHNNYDLGDGWSIGKQSQGDWNVYWKGKHVDCWLNPEVSSEELSSYRHATNAIRCSERLRKWRSCPWSTE